MPATCCATCDQRAPLHSPAAGTRPRSRWLWPTGSWSTRWTWWQTLRARWRRSSTLLRSSMLRRRSCARPTPASRLARFWTCPPTRPTATSSGKSRVAPPVGRAAAGIPRGARPGRPARTAGRRSVASRCRRNGRWSFRFCRHGCGSWPWLDTRTCTASRVSSRYGEKRADSSRMAYMRRCSAFSGRSGLRASRASAVWCSSATASRSRRSSANSSSAASATTGRATGRPKLQGNASCARRARAASRWVAKRRRTLTRSHPGLCVRRESKPRGVESAQVIRRVSGDRSVELGSETRGTPLSTSVGAAVWMRRGASGHAGRKAPPAPNAPKKKRRERDAQGIPLAATSIVGSRSSGRWLLLRPLVRHLRA
mmetsp:Transcript_8822/g.29126  ORF Transcript_8822/g.29126 Transcript_8822/m.29126 type:complete len:369 (-) Transcript_8822:3044-4150(-)